VPVLILHSRIIAATDPDRDKRSLSPERSWARAVSPISWPRLPAHLHHRRRHWRDMAPDQALAAAELGPLPASAMDELDELRRTHPAFRG